MAINRAVESRAWLRVVRAAFYVLLLILPVNAFAAKNCPWMNEVTASGLLHGEAMGTYTASPQSQTSACVFTQQASDGMRTLKIVVTNFPDDPHAGFLRTEAACESDQVPLKSIGNEAVVCALKEDSGVKGTRAIGRVRDQVFEIVITTNLPDDPILTDNALKTRINAAAEQVSGNLF